MTGIARPVLWLMQIGAALMLLVAGVGLTGMVSLAVTLRWRELGIRAAPGATPRR